MIKNITAVVTSSLGKIAQLARWKKRAIVILLDIVLCVQSIWIAYSLRIGVWVLWDIAVQKIVLVCLALMIPVFILTGVYNAIFRYAGTGMMRILIRAFAIYSVAIMFAFVVVGVDGVPRTIGVIQPVVFFVLIGFARLAARYLMVDILGRNQFSGEVKNVLIYGAGSSGQQLAASMRSEPAMRLCGYVDDDRRLDGQRLDGDKVFWSGHLQDLIKKHKITDILLALPRINRRKRRAIVDQIREFKVHVQTLPNIQEIISGKIAFSDIRELEIEDLLGREPVLPNQLLFGRTIVGKTILVTGAGGSIGGELCRQIAKSGAHRLIMMDLSEYALYDIEKQLKKLVAGQSATNLELIPVLGSVVDAGRLDDIFAVWRPDTVFHAAAYKHVPLVEANPIEGIRNNILGTQTLAAAAEAARVKDFILISTDKAVRPTNVMGATKRAAEQVIQNFADTASHTRFSMVRFGNVLGSSGSVVPLFRKQIEQGGPITLTDRRITRYFMTIPEAAQLVIQAAGMAKGGEVFVLDMGNAVKIVDLAETLVRLSGLTVRSADNPDGDIEIVEVGLRAGEKLYEELIIGDDPQETLHPRIMKAHETYLESDELNDLITGLMNCRDPKQAVTMLKSLVPEFDHGRDNENLEKAS